MEANTNYREKISDGNENNEEIKVAKVACSNAVTNPGAMMIKIQNAIVTNTAMRSSWRPKDFTGDAKFD